MPDRPNILFVITDQQRSDYVGTSDVPVRTPNYERLVEQGVGFTNAVCPSPVCGPSRISLATNSEYDNCGVEGNANYPEERRTLYEYLRDDAGYETIGVGDIELIRSPYWGLDGANQIHTFGFSDGIEIPGKNAMIGAYENHISERANGYGTYDPERVPADVNPEAGNPATAYMAFLQERGLLEMYLEDQMERRRSDRPVSQYSTTKPCPLPEDTYVDNWVGQKALEYLRSAPEDRPWHLAVNFVGPHDPLDVTEEMHGWYRDPPVEFPGPVDPAGSLDAETHQEIRRNYAAMCENLDRWLGRYLEVLEERGELDETIVVFTSDHGELLGDHGSWQKFSPRRASSGIPMAISGPGVESRGLVEEPVSLIDLHPTFLEAAGVESQGEGVSLWPFLKGETDDHRSVVRSGLGDWRLVFDGRYQLIVGDNLGEVNGMSADAESPVLFDCAFDPAERTNIAEDAPDTVHRLAKHLPDGFQTKVS